MDYQAILDKYYPSENELRRILLTHSRQVADRCLQIAKAHPELRLDTSFLEEAAMLHDIGIFRCNAPGIQCFGTEPYICHGVIGAEILRQEGWERHALVCERHTGTGLSKEDIEQQQLPLDSARRISNSNSCRFRIRIICLWRWRNKLCATQISFIQRPILAANAL